MHHLFPRALPHGTSEAQWFARPPSEYCSSLDALEREEEAHAARLRAIAQTPAPEPLGTSAAHGSIPGAPVMPPTVTGGSVSGGAGASTSAGGDVSGTPGGSMVDHFRSGRTYSRTSGGTPRSSARRGAAAAAYTPPRSGSSQGHRGYDRRIATTPPRTQSRRRRGYDEMDDDEDHAAGGGESSAFSMDVGDYGTPTATTNSYQLDSGARGVHDESGSYELRQSSTSEFYGSEQSDYRVGSREIARREEDGSIGFAEEDVGNGGRLGYVDPGSMEEIF